MIMEEIKCDKCSDKQDVKDDHASIDKMVVAKCTDCNLNMCTNCVLEHQFAAKNMNHKLVNLFEEKKGQEIEYTNEINNNVITDKFYMPKVEDISDSDIIRRRQIEEEDRQSEREHLQMQQMHQMHQYQLSNQMFANKLKQQQQQNVQSTATNAKLVQIESEINKTFNFYIQMLKERKEYLVKELNTIIQFALLNHNQNINKQLQVQFQLEMKKQQIEKEITDEYDLMNGHQSSTDSTESALKNKLNFLNELNNLILVNNQLISQLKSNNPLMSIEFISNYSAIQTSIRNTFGYIRINPQTQQQHQQHQHQQQQTQQTQQHQVLPLAAANNFNNFNNFNNLNNSKTLPNALSNELSISCDFKSNGAQSQMASSGSLNQQNLYSNNSTSTNVSSLSSASSTSSSSSNSSSNLTSDLVTSPVSIMVKKKNDQNKGTHDQEDKSVQEPLIEEQDQDTEDDTTTLKLNQHQQDTITLSAGSTSSQKSTKSLVSNLSILSNNSSTGSAQNANSAVNSLANLSNTTKHPLSYLYSNFIQSNPKLNNFNFSTQCSADMDNQQHQQSNGSMAATAANSLKTFSLNNLNQGQYTNNQSSNSSINGTYSHLTSGLGSGALSGGLSGSVSGGGASMMNGAHLTSQIQLQRSKMIYHCKFGEFGINDGQFTEPSGVTINTNNDIIVADTNSHRIQIFDKDGNFKFKFGECGKRDGQLLYPNRVSIVKQTGDIVVTERSPTHQIQIYNKYGQFLRKFGANILQHPRGVCVDHKGRIVVVECKVMRVIIFDLYGNVLNKFNCSKYLEFPNGVCCSNPTASNNYREEIYISDNRAHCIKVFDYNGNFIRQIGAEGITNYPIGVGINSNNEILVADNHNNFNLTVFTQDGKLINALESKVKHAQCFDVGLMDDGSIVLASKDYRIYVYKYTTSTQTSLGLSSTATILDQHLNASSISPTSLTNQPQLNFNNYDLFCNNQNEYSLFTNSAPLDSNLQVSSLTAQLIDPFADLANEHLFSLTGPGSDLQSNLASSLFTNAISSDQTDNLNASFSSLLNMSSSNSQSNTNVNNLASILNGIL